jgi:adenylate kinase
MNIKAFIFIGRSGSGKGTQAKLLSDYLKKVDPERKTLYVQSGGEFREFIKGPSQTQVLSREINTAGKLQPEFLAIYMWTNVLVRDFTVNEHIIFDGMPRKYHEAGVLDSIFDFYGIVKPIVVSLKVSEDWAVKHLMARKRADDTEQSIRERLSWFDKEVAPAIDYYRNNSRYSFIEVNGEVSVEDVFKSIVGKLDLK